MSLSLEVAALLLHELTARELPIEVDDNGTLLLRVHKQAIHISLDTLSREFSAGQDQQQIARFVEELVASSEQLLDWNYVQGRIFWLASPADADFGKTHHKVVSDQLVRVMAYVLPEDRGVVWLKPSLLKKWRQEPKVVKQRALGNLTRQLSKTKFHVQHYDKYRLGMFITPSILKASLIFAPTLRAAVEPELGWPILALLPCRDFLYLLPEAEAEFLPRVRPAVLSEYLQHVYPISTEVYRLSDAGIEVVETFDVEDLQA